MKLVKALNKSLQQESKRTFGAGKAQEVAKPLAGARVQGQAEWQAPVYRQSSCMAADSKTAISNRCVALQVDEPTMDYYKVLRTQLMQRMQPKGWNTLMVTSTRPGEGKTLTSVNLALTFAMAYSQTALLVDCDLRNQSVYRHLGIDSEKSIADHLVNATPLSELIIWPKVENMTLISGRRTVQQSAELLGSPRMRELMVEMKNRYNDRYVIVDAPPLLVGADALSLAPLVDGVVMVVESGGPPLKEIQEALAMIPKEKFLGFVLNKHCSRRKGYYYRYGKSA